ncbi:DUF5659 domain-containing protein [Clostridium sp.]|uniref:DUF5659 domain-containing protein n=1 Tax=Clostridium sp. TaxID=1506 RepID=UPI00262CA653|nr:DUF5659 domain-containing protein [Clostridium sp.]
MIKVKSNTKIAYLLTLGFKEERLEETDSIIYFMFKDTEEIRQQIEIFKNIVSNKEINQIFWIDYKKYLEKSRYVRDKIREFKEVH